ncbi:MAG: PQQ-dependent sugar dehydrogenase [Nitrososphaeraceae archaeon]
MIIGVILFYVLFHFHIIIQNFDVYGIYEFPQVIDPNLKVEEVADRLEMPTSIAFLESSDLLVLEKNGTVLRIINKTILDDPVLHVSVASGFYQGLLGIAVMNQTNSKNDINVFLYYTEVQSNKQKDNTETITNETFPIGNRVYKYELVNNKLINPIMLLDLPAKPGPEDNGGFITIGPDNHPYIIIGEIASSSRENALETLAQNYENSSIVDGRSGILRITLDGNPVLDEKGHGLLGDTFPLNLYYAYGIHNGFGMDFDPITGNLWDTETGHIINDEINIVKLGFNSGYGIMQGQRALFR